MNLQAAREQMVEQQVRAWDVLDERVLQTMLQVQREEFAPLRYRDVAFADAAIPLAHGQSMLPAKVHGRILQALEVTEGSVALEVGAGTGYLSACLGKLASRVRSFEIFPDLERAHARGELAETGGQVAGASADFQRDAAFGDLERLQDASMHFRRQHRLAVRERNRGVRERDVAVTQRRKLLPLHLEHRLQDAFVEHVPGSDLLLDHLLARGLEIHLG